ncbi:hypothetical protein KFE25_013476 [Diacronema lutheri]|uniref:Uncharacterized protein n=1 Tax=Diacronema lutheri TaxID=2081491 RepID=A0A8J5XIT9_DIALT|nr:hypothetical protein KFE25_013476 [Diacronema lutheri]
MAERERRSERGEDGGVSEAEALLGAGRSAFRSHARSRCAYSAACALITTAVFVFNAPGSRAPLGSAVQLIEEADLDLMVNSARVSPYARSSSQPRRSGEPDERVGASSAAGLQAWSCALSADRPCAYAPPSRRSGVLTILALRGQLAVFVFAPGGAPPAAPTECHVLRAEGGPRGIRIAPGVVHSLAALPTYGGVRAHGASGAVDGSALAWTDGAAGIGADVLPGSRLVNDPAAQAELRRWLRDACAAPARTRANVTRTAPPYRHR